MKGVLAVIEPGTVVRWTSQAHGSWTEKEGTVIAYLQAYADARRVLAAHGVSDRLMAQPVSRYDRYLVRVRVGPKATRVYAPLARVLEQAVRGVEGT